jgi:hypothetical protein
VDKKIEASSEELFARKPRQMLSFRLSIRFDLSEWLFSPSLFPLLGRQERGPEWDNRVTVAKLHEICYDY